MSERDSMSSDFTDDFSDVVTYGRVLANINPRSTEESYRTGYRDGYRQAADEMRYLKRKGYIRVHEIANILWHFGLFDLLRWRNDHEEGFKHPPQIKVDSWSTVRSRIFKRDGRSCAWCGSTKDLQIDHKIPVCDGGLPVNNNLQVLCKRCNLFKGRYQATTTTKILATGILNQP